MDWLFKYHASEPPLVPLVVRKEVITSGTGTSCILLLQTWFALSSEAKDAGLGRPAQGNPTYSNKSYIPMTY